MEEVELLSGLVPLTLFFVCSRWAIYALRYPLMIDARRSPLSIDALRYPLSFVARRLTLFSVGSTEQMYIVADATRRSQIDAPEPVLTSQR